jgi:hypothetical protein
MTRARQTVIILAATILAGCGQPTATTSPTTAARAKPVNADVATLLARPIKLPRVSASLACPVTPIADVATTIGSPRGKGPFYLGGGMPTGGFAFNKVVSVNAAAPSPVLLRGGRIDGSGSLRFSGNPADLADEPQLSLSPGQGSWAFYSSVFDDGGANAFYLYPSTRGCYAIQVDAATFREVIVLEAR